MLTVGDLFKEAHTLHLEGSDVSDYKKIAEAADKYKDLLNTLPNDLGVLFGYATCEMQLGYNGLAITLFEKCLSMKELPEVYNNLGTCYRAEGHNEQAKECWDKALSMRQDADYYNNVVTLYVNQGCPEKGMEAALKGISLDPEHARLHWNYSLLLLEQGRWEEGLKEYEWGIPSKDRPLRLYSDKPDGVPFWDGTKGKKVVVYGEQGVGDEIMYASCIPDMMKDCEVIFDCHPRMVDLFTRSFGVKCYGTRKSPKITWPSKEKPDYKLALGSIFGLYRNNGVFPKQPYLVPDAKLVKKYRKKLEAAGPGPYVGIGWVGGTKVTNTSSRSFKLGHMKPIFDHGGTFVSLQYSEGASEKVERMNAEGDYYVHHWPEVVEVGEKNENEGFNYDHTVALIAALDLCILPNTAAVHVCGALGKECWTLTPNECAWRYQLSGDEMPMYKSVKQIRGDDRLVIAAERYGDYKRMYRGARPELATAASG